MAGSDHAGSSTGQHGRDLLRTELFSDAVLAIALTLLALDLSVSGYETGHLADSLGESWPSYVAFLGSFVFIAVMWLNHHAAFMQLRTTTAPFLWANFGVLLGAVVLPFPTRVLAEALQSSNRADERAAVALYAGIAALMGLSWTAFWFVIARNPKMWSNPDSAEVWQKALRRSVPGALGYVVAGLLGVLVAPEIALVFFIALPLWRRRTGALLARS